MQVHWLRIARFNPLMPCSRDNRYKRWAVSPGNRGGLLGNPPTRFTGHRRETVSAYQQIMQKAAALKNSPTGFENLPLPVEAGESGVVF
jgi:hypothetical protein